jgi:hypothetical protein
MARLGVFYRLLLLCLILIGFSFLAFSQGDPAGGILPFSTQAQGIADSIDLASSNINLTIKARDKVGKLPFSYNLVMNSPPERWVVSGTGDAGGTVGFSGQLSVGATLGYSITQSNVTCSNQGSAAFEFTNFVVTDSTGGVHPVSNIPVIWINAPAACGYSYLATGWTTDGSGYTLVATPYTYTAAGGMLLAASTFTVYDRSGNVYNPNFDPNQVTPQPTVLVQDPDGSSIIYTQLSLGSGYTITDTLGQEAIRDVYSTGYEYIDAAGNNQIFQPNFNTYTQQTVFGCQGPQDISPTSIGLLSSLTTPTGTITFIYI